MCIITSITTAGIVTALKIVGGILAVAATATSTTMGAISAHEQGKQQQAYYNYQAKVEEQNAKIAENNAATERQQGIEEARLQRIKAAQAIGSQQTAMAANGVDVTQGTALDVISDTAAMGELDALQTKYNYERKALAYEAQADNFRNQGNLDIIAGQNAYSAGRMNSLAYGLEGISKTASVADKWFGGIKSNDDGGGFKLSFGKKKNNTRIDSAYNNLA